MLTTSGTYPWSFVTQIFHNGQPSHGGDRKISEVMTSTLPKRNPPDSIPVLGKCWHFVDNFVGPTLADNVGPT